MAAEILEASANGFAAAANADLQRAGETGLDSSAWKAHFRQRLLELAAAVRAGEPGLFHERIQWLRRAARARGGSDQAVITALGSLRNVLGAELATHLQGSVIPIVDHALDAPIVDSESESFLDPTDAFGKLASDYSLLCLDARSEDAVQLILDAIEDGLSVEDAYCNVLIPAQQEIGRLWHLGEVSVSEERLISETTRRTMANVTFRFRPAKPVGRSVLAASVSGNAHDLGLRVVADLFILAGWKCLFLGANVPASDIAVAAAGRDVDVVILAATLETQLNALAATVTEIRTLTPDARILVGGAAFDSKPELWTRAGANAFVRRAEEAVAQATRLLEDT